jgi:hypothetical protein
MSGRGCSSIQALLIFLRTWDVVEAAAAIMNLRGGGQRVTKVATSRSRWCDPHNASGQGCRCCAERGHQYSRLHVGIPFLWKATALPRTLVAGITVLRAGVGISKTR